MKLIQTPIYNYIFLSRNFILLSDANVMCGCSVCNTYTQQPVSDNGNDNVKFPNKTHIFLSGAFLFFVLI